MTEFLGSFVPGEDHRRHVLANLVRVKVEYLFHDWHLNR